MNNKQQNQNRSLLDTQRDDTAGSYENFMKRMSADSDTARNNATNLRDQVYNRYNSGNAFMPEGMTTNSSGWFNLPDDGSGGGASAAGGDYSSAKSGYQKFADTGGAEDYQPALDSYKGFMNNGGLGAQTRDDMRYRATSMVPAFYDKFKSALSRRSNVQGGYSPGFDSQMAEIGKQAGREGYNASRLAESDIADKELQGKMFGTSGYAQAAGNITGNKLSGLGGLKGIGDSEQQNNQYNAGLSESRAGRNQQMQLALQQMYQSGKMNEASGLSDLYKGDRGDQQNSLQNWLAAMSGKTGNDMNNLALRNAIKNKSVNWDAIIKAAGTGGSLALMASDRNIKENVEEFNIIEKFKQIPINTWNYIGEDIRHLGPMAQDMKRIFNVGDGKTISMVDVSGLIMLLGKALAHEAR